MLNKNVIQDLLNEALVTGADFAELFFEDTNQEAIRVTSKDVSNVSFNNVHGVGVRLIKNNDVVYGYSNDVSEEKVRALVMSLSASFSGDKKEATSGFTEMQKNVDQAVSKGLMHKNQAARKKSRIIAQIKAL